jgi:hypothetical protein
VFESIVVAERELRAEEEDVREFEALLHGTAKDRLGGLQLAAMAITRPDIAEALDVRSDQVDVLKIQLKEVETERKKLALQR